MLWSFLLLCIARSSFEPAILRKAVYQIPAVYDPVGITECLSHSDLMCEEVFIRFASEVLSMSVLPDTLQVFERFSQLMDGCKLDRYLTALSGNLPYLGDTIVCNPTLVRHVNFWSRICTDPEVASDLMDAVALLQYIKRSCYRSFMASHTACSESLHEILGAFNATDFKTITINTTRARMWQDITDGIVLPSFESLGSMVPLEFNPVGNIACLFDRTGCRALLCRFIEAVRPGLVLEGELYIDSVVKFVTARVLQEVNITHARSLLQSSLDSRLQSALKGIPETTNDIACKHSWHVAESAPGSIGDALLMKDYAKLFCLASDMQGAKFFWIRYFRAKSSTEVAHLFLRLVKLVKEERLLDILVDAIAVVCASASIASLLDLVSIEGYDTGSRRVKAACIAPPRALLDAYQIFEPSDRHIIRNSLENGDVNLVSKLSMIVLNYFTVRYIRRNPSRRLVYCCICLDYIDSSEVAETPCMHRFHCKCLLSWLSCDSSCPSCRRRLPPSDD